MKLRKIADQISFDQNRPTLFQLLVNAKGIPMATSFKIGKVHKKMTEEVDAYIKLRNEKIEELGETVFFEDVYFDKKGKEIKDKEKAIHTGKREVTDEEKQKGLQPTTRVKKENEEKFFAEEKELLEKDIDINMPVIKAEELGEPILELKDESKGGEMKKIELTPIQISSLDWLIS